jgi:hypothetical protein
MPGHRLEDAEVFAVAEGDLRDRDHGGLIEYLLEQVIGLAAELLGLDVVGGLEVEAAGYLVQRD